MKTLTQNDILNQSKQDSLIELITAAVFAAAVSVTCISIVALFLNI